MRDVAQIPFPLPEMRRQLNAYGNRLGCFSFPFAEIILEFNFVSFFPTTDLQFAELNFRLYEGKDHRLRDHTGLAHKCLPD